MGYSVVSSPRVRIFAASAIAPFALLTIYTVFPLCPVLQATLVVYDVRALFSALPAISALSAAVVQLGYDVLRVAPSPLLSLARYLAASAEPYASLTMVQLYKIYARTFSGLRTDALSTIVSIFLWSNLALTFVFFALYLPWVLFSFVTSLDDNDLRFIATLNTYVTHAIRKIKAPLERLQQCLPHACATISGLIAFWPTSLLRAWCYSSHQEVYSGDSLGGPRCDGNRSSEVYLTLPRLIFVHIARSISLVLLTLVVFVSSVYGMAGLYTIWAAYHIHKRVISPQVVASSPTRTVPISRPIRTTRPSSSSILASTISSHLPDNYYLLQDFVDQYELGAKLGAGSFGVVFQARRHVDGCEVAIKFVKKGVHSQFWEEHPVYGRMPHDVIVMDLVRHENIITLLDVFSDDRYVYIVQEIHGSLWYPTGEQDKERFPNGSRCLESYLCANGAMPLEDAKYIFYQLVEAVYMLHMNGVTHCDIKPANILIDSNLKVKLIDFGNVLHKPAQENCNYFDLRVSYSDYRWFCGTKVYTPPEIFRCKQLGQSFEAPPADIWALGLVLCQLLTGSPPIITPHGYLNGFLEYDTKDSSQWEALLPMWGVLDACLDPIPQWRPSIQLLRQRDEHNWAWLLIRRKISGRTIHM